jgi:hypothetical protein
MFPTDAITIRYEINGVGSISLASSTRTILYTTIQKATANKTASIDCNGYVLSSNFSTNIFNSNPINYICNGVLNMSATANGTASFVITYVNRDISLIPPVSTSTIPLYINGFSYDGVLTIMLLIFIFTAIFFKTLKEWIFGMKTDGIIRIIGERNSKL